MKTRGLGLIFGGFGLVFSTGVQGQIQFPAGTENFEAMQIGDSVATLTGWVLVNTSAPPANFTVRAANDVLGNVQPRGASTKWLRSTDMDAANVQNRFYSPTLTAPVDLDYKWTFFVNLENTPPGAGATKPKLTIQHVSGSFANAWGIEFSDTGASLVVLGIGGAAASAPLYAFASPTGLGDWVKLELWVNFTSNTVSASANDGLAVSLPISLTGDKKVFRFCYRGEGTGNVLTMLVDDVSVATATPCCLPSGSCILHTDEDCLAAGGTSPPDSACAGDSDGDGVDAVCGDDCPSDPNKTSPGVCGCLVPDVDTDHDGVADCIDGCPNDANKTEPGVCGCGVDDSADADGDTVPDCVDRCSGFDDRIDEDGDGIPDCFEAIPAVSQWGIIILALTLLVAAKIHFSRRQHLILAVEQ